MNDELISIIIPVYNVENYIEKCLDSVLRQDYQNIEVILIDDGSTDRSSQICDSYKIKDNRVRVLHKKNAGLASARNCGIDIAKGQWISFIDSDDWIEPSMIRILLEIAKKTQADISSCAINRVSNDNDTNTSFSINEAILELDETQIIKGLLTQEIVRFEVWNKLWKRSIISDCRFIEGQVSEDVHWDRIIFPRANKMAYINIPLYNYRVSRPGNTQSTFKRARMCVFEEFNAWISELENKGDHESAEIIRSIALNFAVLIYEEAFSKAPEKKTLLELKKIFHDYFDNDLNNKYYNKKMTRLFSISPVLYCLTLRLKQKL